ncbi:dipeptide/oligopeptide/nickel ABC transporter permease/ATP-binding protein [Plantibacter flavus]|uniref:dipeptide/oligopeptide/nickel ABC transporter permease/ATP-binding protein n=1 Tax=Plantibacter flavus TaxID=150123 RepID=UPI003F168ADC
MTAAVDPTPTVALALEGERDRRSVLARLLRSPQAVLCSLWILLVVICAVFAPVLAPYSINATDLDIANLPPFSPGHLLGGDVAGYDILSRLIWGSRQTLIAVVLVTVVSVALGVTSGLIAGFYRGRFEAVAGFVSDIILSLPGIVLLIALYALTGPNLAAAMSVFGVIVAPNYYRLVRSIVIGVRGELYVDAARVVGLSDVRIVGRHILWAVQAPVIIQTAFIMAAGIGIEAGVSFIGLGDPTQASWGQTLQTSFRSIYFNPAGVLWPSLVISISILAFILLGNALSDVLQESARVKAPTRRQRAKLITAAIAELGEDTASASGTEQDLSPDVVLSVRGLRIGYPTPAGGVVEVVHGVDLDLRRGEIHGLVGESGSGKSQIAFSMLGILPRDALTLGGTVLLDGHDLLEDDQSMARARGRRIAYVPQEPMSNLDPSFTIGAQLLRGVRASRQMSKAAATEHLLVLLGRVGINDPERVMGLYPHEISGGMAQRVLICGAVASDPDIIVADEPTTALDVTVQAEVLELLRELCAERGLAMLLVTHNLGVVADVCQTVSVMRSGLIVEHADVDDLFERPREAYTRKLLASSLSVGLAGE